MKTQHLQRTCKINFFY